MSFVFSIPNIITQALRAMLREVQKATVSVLAERFGFSADEAMRVLDSNGEPDVVPDFIPLAAMPWIGVVDEDKCEAITFNKGLYTQCQGEKTAGNCCRKCANLKEKKGTFTYGDVHARMGSDPMEYKNVRPFLSAMEKNGWTEDLVTRSAQHYNGTVDPRNFKKKSRARGRPANAGMAAPPIPIEFETSEPQGEPPEAPASPPYVPAAESESESEDEDEIAFTEDYVNGLNKADLIVEGKRLGIELKENGKPRKMADVKEEIIRRFIHGDETIPE